jgi:hypothetical protein
VNLVSISTLVEPVFTALSAYWIFGEPLTAMGVAGIMWTGDWEIKQGATVLFKSSSNSSGFWDLTSQGVIFQGANVSANITANTAGSASTLSLRLTKYSYNTAGV